MIFAAFTGTEETAMRSKIFDLQGFQISKTLKAASQTQMSPNWQAECDV